MKRNMGLAFLLSIFIVTVFLLIQSYEPQFDRKSMALSSTSQKKLSRIQSINRSIEEISLPFVPNLGQLDESVKFYAPIVGGTAFVTSSGKIVYFFNQNPDSDKQNLTSTTLIEEIVGSNINTIVGEQKTNTKINIFHGNDQSKWKTNLPSYNAINLGEAYEGIELKLKAYGRTVEKLFYVKEGADPNKIRVQLSGVNEIKLESEGAMRVRTANGDIRFSKPVAYQEHEDGKEFVEVAYLLDGQEYGFQLGEYDESRELIIDPILSSTFLGGSDAESAHAVTIDDEGNIYVGGVTLSVNFPGIDGNSFDSTHEGAVDAFVVMLDSDLNNILSATFIGGNDVIPSPGPAEREVVFDILLDNVENVYIAGVTSSPDFPGVEPASSVDSTFGAGEYEGFVAKLSPDLSILIASTYIGGNALDTCYEMVTNNAGDLYVVGFTSTVFGSEPLAFPGIGPSSADPLFQGTTEYFVVKLSPDLNTLLASTFVGGESLEDGSFFRREASIGIDSSENILIAGGTESLLFPGLGPASADNLNNGTVDMSEAVVTKISPDLSTIHVSTYLGGSIDDSARTLMIDSLDNVIIGGITSSPDLPGVTLDSADSSIPGSTIHREGFVAKIDNNLSAVLEATYLGGTIGWTEIEALSLDSNDNVYVTGYTESDDLPGVTHASADSIFIGETEGFFSILDSDLSTVASTFLGGFDSDYGRDIAFMTRNFEDITYIVGSSSSPDFPEIKGTSADNIFGGTDEAFAVKLNSFASVNIIDLEDILILAEHCFFCPPEVHTEIEQLVLIAIEQISAGSKFVAANTVQELINSVRLFMNSGELPREFGIEILSIANSLLINLTENIDTLCSTLGDNRFKSFPDFDSFTFKGKANEVVNITLDMDPQGISEGSSATLVLTKFRPRGKLEINRSKVPNIMATQLKADGTYRIIVAEQVFKPNSFEGDYCLSIETESGVLLELIPGISVE